MPKFEKPTVRTTPDNAQATWMRTHHEYVLGSAVVTTLDVLATEMEARWGADRLRRLVPEELRAKFDSQRLKTSYAIWSGTLEDLRREATRMQAAWRAADKAATEAGASRLPAAVWEVALEDGSVAAIVRDSADAGLVVAEGRQVVVYTLEEVARLLGRFPALSKAKQIWPGATVTALNRAPADPLHAID